MSAMDLEAFEKKVLPAKNKLFRFALRFLGDEEEAKDIVQEVFMRVWNGRHETQQIHNWEAWCMRITRNLSLDRIRLTRGKQTEGLEENFDLQHDALSPHESAELDESLKKVAGVIAALPEKQRQIIHLRDIEGHSYQEICEILDLDMNQVKVNLFRARNTVREKMIKIDAYGL